MAKPWLPNCPTTGKVCHDSLRFARIAIKRMRAKQANTTLYAYHCLDCGHYHIGNLSSTNSHKQDPL